MEGVLVGKGVPTVYVGKGVRGACEGEGVTSLTVGERVALTKVGVGASVISVPRNLRARARVASPPCMVMSASIVVEAKQSISSSTPVHTERYLKMTS